MTDEPRRGFRPFDPANLVPWSVPGADTGTDTGSDTGAEPEPARAPEPWEALLDDDWMDWPVGADDDDGRDDDDEQREEGAGDTGDDSPSTPARLAPDALRQIFGAIEIADEVDEDLDDLIPEIDDSGPFEWEQALEIIGAGVQRCAVLKTMASSQLFAPVARELKSEIRAAKRRIVARRTEFRNLIEQQRRREEARDRDAEVERQRRIAQGPSSRSRGFAAWGEPGGKTDAEYAAEIKKINDDANEEIRKMREETEAKRRRSADRRHQMFIDYIRGVRRYVVIVED